MFGGGGEGGGLGTAFVAIRPETAGFRPQLENAVRTAGQAAGVQLRGTMGAAGKGVEHDFQQTGVSLRTIASQTWGQMGSTIKSALGPAGGALTGLENTGKRTFSSLGSSGLNFGSIMKVGLPIAAAAGAAALV